MLWFNPLVPDVPVDDSSGTSPRSGRAHGTAGRRVRKWLALALAMLVPAGAAIMALSLRGSDSARPAAAAVPRFADETSLSGIEHTYSGDFEFFVGGGVAAFDCDDDGRPELYFAGGSEPAALFRNESTVGEDLRFVRIRSAVTDLTAVTGAYPIDIDGDVRVDLAVLRRGGNTMLRGLGGCRFEAADDSFRIERDDDWTTAFSATWEGSNALPTLAFGNYLVPDEDTCDESKLLRPAADGEGYDPAIPLRPGYCTLSMLFSDWSRSGRRDLRVTNDRHYYTDGGDQLWQMVSGQPPREYTVADGWQRLQIWGMGIASQDVTGDGYPEVYITSQGDNKLQTLADDPSTPTYRDIALRRGVTAQRPFVGGDVLPSTAWHPEFEDLNNDGFVDLFVSKGNVEAQPDFAARDPSNLLVGPSRRDLRRGSGSGGHRRLRAVARRGAGRPQPRRTARPGRRASPRERRRLAEYRGGRTRPTRDRWVTGSAFGFDNPHPTSMRSVPGWRLGSVSAPSFAR